MRRLIVTADDVGLDRGMTEGAIRAHRDGIVTACSVVANGAAFDDAVERLREFPSLEVGVHLALVEERALTTGERMPANYVHFLLSRRTVDVERELRAQVEKVIATGLRVTHLNGHQHLHVLPGIFEVVLRLAVALAIPYIRIPNDIGSAAPFRFLAVSALNLLGRRARGQAGRSVTSCDATIGIFGAGSIDESVISDLFEQIPDGVTEFVTHPGVGVDGYRHWDYRWENETRLLCSPRLRALIESLGIRLVAPSEVDAS